MRVISLCPSNTELVEYLGLTDSLIAVDDYSDWPKEVEQLPKVGPDLSIDMDLVAELKPDLVLASLSVPGMEKNIEALKSLHIPHIVLNPQSLADIEEDLKTVGKAIGEPELGIEAAAKFRLRLDELKQNAGKAGGPRPRLYWEWWPKPIFTPGKHNWLTEISDAAGAFNIFADVELASVQTDWEDVINRKPDFICLAWVGVRKKKIQKSTVSARPGFDQLSLPENRILILEEELYCRPSPRLLDGLEKLTDLIRAND